MVKNVTVAHSPSIAKLCAKKDIDLYFEFRPGSNAILLMHRIQITLVRQWNDSWSDYDANVVLNRVASNRC